jgi:hypothetical protein
MSVIHISDGPEADIEDIQAKLRSDKGSIDYLGITSDTDPLAHPDLYRIIKSVRPKWLKVLIVTDGRDPDVLDDLIGAEYVHAADLHIGRTMTDDQRRCISLLMDGGCRFAVTVNAGEHDSGSLVSVANGCKGCSMFILKQDKSKPLTRSEMSTLADIARGCTWNVRTIT